ncbi:hypothetical protein AGRO_2720 [Agrobacterium sp. ATCC 31749]|nr:hypothetical protein AGRO_2720 [Agrobacterium sp. ATCC 31749]
MTVVPPNGLEHFQEEWTPVFRLEMRLSRLVGQFCRGQA